MACGGLRVACEMFVVCFGLVSRDLRLVCGWFGLGWCRVGLGLVWAWSAGVGGSWPRLGWVQGRPRVGLGWVQGVGCFGWVKGGFLVGPRVRETRLRGDTSKLVGEKDKAEGNKKNKVRGSKERISQGWTNKVPADGSQAGLEG